MKRGRWDDFAIEVTSPSINGIEEVHVKTIVLLSSVNLEHGVMGRSPHFKVKGPFECVKLMVKARIEEQPGFGVVRLIGIAID